MNIRLTVEEAKLIEDAAAIKGESVRQFIRRASEERAKAVLRNIR